MSEIECRKCGDYFNSDEIKYGLCPKCYDSDEVECSSCRNWFDKDEIHISTNECNECYWDGYGDAMYEQAKDARD